MKKITILFFVSIFTLKIIGQNAVNNDINIDSSSLKNVFEAISLFESTKDLAYLDVIEYPLVCGLEEKNRKRNEEEWGKQLVMKTNLSLLLINRVANFPNFTFDWEKHKIPNIIQIPCADKYNLIKNISDIKDENCIKEYQKLLKEREVLVEKVKYEHLVLRKYWAVMQDLFLIFDFSSYTSVKEIDEFVLPYVEQNIDSKQKQEQFRKDYQMLKAAYLKTNKH